MKLRNASSLLSVIGRPLRIARTTSSGTFCIPEITLWAATQYSHVFSTLTLRAICGQIEVSYRGVRGALNLLKTPIVEHLPPGDRVRNALNEFVYELANPTVGTRALARSLMSQCVILLLRRRYKAGDPSLKWMEGTTDKTLWTVLQTMLDRPGAPHSVKSLADASGMSRSAFADRFSEVYGNGPIELLTIIRLQRAAELLVRSDLPVKRIAELVGYKSRSYFTRAFETEYGASPRQFKVSTPKTSGHTR